jgi:hypothetical protein
MRKGKICAWAPTYEDHKTDARVRKRLKLCLEAFLPEASAEVGAAPPQNIIDAEAKREKRKRKREEEESYRLPHLASPSPPMSTMKLAPMLALPRTYVDIMTNPALRYSLADDTMESGLQRTASELLEGEKGLMQSLGRLREVLRVRERDVLEARVPPTSNGTEAEAVANANKHAETNGHGHAVGSTNGDVDGKRIKQSDSPPPKIPPLPHVSDTDNLWRVTQELLQGQPQPTITFTPTDPDSVDPSSESQPTPTPVQRLFTIPAGLTINAVPSKSHPALRLPKNHQAYPVTVRYNLDMATQCRAVDDALERISELLADCMEYKERLEEARDRVADVSRARKKVWAVVKERAGRELDREGKV